MDHDALLLEFCKEQFDTLYSANTRKRKSVLLQIKDDVDYNLGFFKTFRPLGLSVEQHRQIDRELAPLFVVPLLFCSAVDLMARVKHKGAHSGENARIFKDSAVSFFELDPTEASKLWSFRCSISHQYSIRNFVISRYGGPKVLEIINDRVVVQIRPMKGSLSRAIDKLFEYLSNENDEEKGLTANFLDKHGFTYYLVV